MTSGNFSTMQLSAITVIRDERQRRTLTGIEELAESINRIGLINPIVVTSDGILVAGERRYTACKSLGWTSIPVQFVEDLSEYELAVIELEENVKRVDLTWQDHCAAIARFHELKAGNEEDWTQERTASSLGLTQSEVSQNLAIAKEIVAGNERVAKAERFSVARNLVQRDAERKRASVLESLPAIVTKMAGEEPKKPEAKQVPIINADFNKWSKEYTGQPFNLIHCDFPYGIDVADSPRQNAGIQEYYEDTPEVYFKLLDSLSYAMDNVVAESAHLIFWFSMKHYAETLKQLEWMGWKVNPFPLIWHKSDNSGIAPDPQRSPRRTYETAFFASRGDRKLTQAGALSNSLGFPGRGGEGIHLSEKPVPMLQHFMRMICDEYSTVLDPTCGSGNALKAASALGAARVLGIEKDPDFYATSVLRYYGGSNG